MRQVWVVMLLLVGLAGNGQNRPLLYNVDDLPQSLLQNPGTRIDFTRHFGVPFLSQVHVFAGSTGVTAYDVFKDDWQDINQRIEDVVAGLTSGDFFTVNEQLEIFSFGKKVGKRGYISAGIYQEADVFAYFPKDPATLAVEGNVNYIDIPFDFSDVNFNGEVLAVYHIGYHYKVDPKLNVGGRVKFYSGIFNVESTNNSGNFITNFTPGGTNFYEHSLNRLDVLIRTAGYASLKDTPGMTVEEATAELLARSMFGRNIGAGVDLGFSYRVTEQLSFNAAIQDLGLMFHHQDVENYHYYGSHSTSGLEPLFPELKPGQGTIPYWDIFEEQIDANLKDETTFEEYNTWRPLKYNASVEFGTGKSILPCDYLISKKPRYMNLFGMLLSGVNRPKGPTYRVTTYWDRKINGQNRFRVAYSLDQFSVTKLGAMYSTRLKNFNFYLAVDDLLGYINLADAHSVSLQLGMQYVFKKK